MSDFKDIVVTDASSTSRTLSRIQLNQNEAVWREKSDVISALLQPRTTLRIQTPPRGALIRTVEVVTEYPYSKLSDGVETAPYITKRTKYLIPVDATPAVIADCVAVDQSIQVAQNISEAILNGELIW